MLASENDALIGGKVGGVGDVVRDLPRALAVLGIRTTVIVPSYGFLHTRNPSTIEHAVNFPFGGKIEHAEVWKSTSRNPTDGIAQLLVHHPAIIGDPIYSNDPPGHAFAQDAMKYALFCSAVGQFLRSLDPASYVLHLHDWHTPFLLLLRDVHPAFTHLQGIHTAFTIHNIALQGTRPMRGNMSSVEQWFPELFHETQWIDHWKDRRYDDATFTPMAAGIRFSNKVNTVSPTYAEEILKPSVPEDGFYGGEGLERELREAKSEGRLSGILNGCDYPPDREVPRMTFAELCALMQQLLGKGIGADQQAFDTMMLERVRSWQVRNPRIILTSVSRVVEQKMKLLFERGDRSGRAIDEILTMLEACDGIYIVLGSGSEEYEERFLQACRQYTRLLYFRGYSERLAPALYANGTLFLMPSSFEPCGISQMLAMRDCQPCIVHAVGGLKDTVSDGVNGFSFSGTSIAEQVDALVATTRRAITIALNEPATWSKLREAAGKARFTWEESANAYVEQMYQPARQR
jgi:starch synthase